MRHSRVSSRRDASGFVGIGVVGNVEILVVATGESYETGEFLRALVAESADIRRVSLVRGKVVVIAESMSIPPDLDQDCGLAQVLHPGGFGTRDYEREGRRRLIAADAELPRYGASAAGGVFYHGC